MVRQIDAVDLVLLVVNDFDITCFYIEIVAFVIKLIGPRVAVILKLSSELGKIIFIILDQIISGKNCPKDRAYPGCFACVSAVNLFNVQ